jgi:hypothetical protein
VSNGTTTTKTKEAPVCPERGEDSDEDSFRAKVVEALRAERGRSFKSIGLAVYGSDDDRTTGRVRAMLTVLQKQGKVRNYGHAKWEAVDQK